MKLSGKTRATLRYLWLLFLAASGGLVTDRLLFALRDYDHVPEGRGGLVVVCLVLTVGVWWVAAVEWRRSCRGARYRPKTIAFGALVGTFAVVSAMILGCCFLAPPRALTVQEQHYWGEVTAIDAGNTADAEAIIVSGGDNDDVPEDVCCAWGEDSSVCAGHRLLALAVAADNIPVAETLLKHGARIPGYEGSPACLNAARLGDVAMMRLLMDYGATLRDFSYEGGYEGEKDALTQAVEKGKTDEVAFLLAHGDSPNNGRSAYESKELLLIARRNKKGEIVKLLLKAGVKEY